MVAAAQAAAPRKDKRRKGERRRKAVRRKDLRVLNVRLRAKGSVEKHLARSIDFVALSHTYKRHTATSLPLGYAALSQLLVRLKTLWQKTRLGIIVAIARCH